MQTPSFWHADHVQTSAWSGLDEPAQPHLVASSQGMTVDVAPEAVQLYGEISVVEWGVSRYWNKNLEILVSRSLGVVLLRASLTVCTARSAIPLEDGWYGATVTCRIPFLFVNSWNSILVKAVLLSETRTSGRPCIGKVERSF